MNTINKKNVTWNPRQELRSSIRIAAQSLWKVCAASWVYHYYRGREMMKLESNAAISPQSNMTNNKDHTGLGTPIEWRRTVFRKKKKHLWKTDQQTRSALEILRRTVLGPDCARCGPFPFNRLVWYCCSYTKQKTMDSHPTGCLLGSHNWIRNSALSQVMALICSFIHYTLMTYWMF